MEKIILVTGATGQQGGAVIKSLLNSDWKLRAITRDENKPASQELKKAGVEVKQGDMNDSAFLEKAAEGAYGVFSVQNFWEHGYEGELNQGKWLADAASKAGVQHFVQSSVGGAERKSNLPHFDVKFELENYIKELKLPYTIIRPVFFMENFNTFNKPEEKEGKTVFNLAMKPDTKLQMIAAEDIGAITTAIFNNPKEYLGKEIEIAGDDLTMPEVAEIYSKVTGKDAVFNEMPMDGLRAYSEELANMFQWFIDHGYEADIPAVKKIHPKLLSFESWLAKNK